MTLEDYLEEKEEEYHLANLKYGCGCPGDNPPCDFCVQGYSVPLEEYLGYAEEEWLADHPETTKDPYHDYDKAMQVLDL